MIQKIWEVQKQREEMGPGERLDISDLERSIQTAQLTVSTLDSVEREPIDKNKCLLTEQKYIWQRQRAIFLKKEEENLNTIDAKKKAGIKRFVIRDPWKKIRHAEVVSFAKQAGLLQKGIPGHFPS